MNQGAHADRPEGEARLGPLLGFFLLAAALVDFSTDTPRLGPFYKWGPATQATSAACAAGLVLAGLLALWRPGSRATPGPAAARVGAIALRLLPISSMVLAFFWTRPFVDPALGRVWNLLVVGAPLLLVGCAIARLPAVAVAGLCAAVGLLVRLVHFAHFPIDVGADMLPLVRSALTSFVAGRSPYAYYDLPDPLPLTYYPITWLAYLPPFLLEIDLRWTNLVAELAVPAALLALGRADGDGRWARGLRRRGTEIALVAWGWYFLLPSSIYFDRITTAPVAWALVVWMLGAVALRWRGDFLLVAATAAATPLVAVFAPAVALVWLRRDGARRAAIKAAGAALGFAAVVLPFYLWSPRGFVDGAILWFNDLDRFPRTKWVHFQTWRRYVGFGGLFWAAGREGLLKLLQGAAILGVTALFWVRGAEPRRLAAHVAAAFVLFMVVNPVHWPYFYQPALFCGLVAIATAARAPAEA
jgi:hypothetical protein